MRRRHGNLVRGQEGMASFVVVSILIVLLTLISLGFARLMQRASQNARNQQAATAATYAAESGINDVATYIKKNPTAKSDNCVGTGSLIGSSTAPGPFYNDANLSGDNYRSTQYTCLLLNQTPQDLVYQNLPTDENRIVKATTSAFAGALDKMMISWQPTNNQLTGYPPNTTPLLDATTWNSTTDNYVPMLRVTLYPIPVGGSVSAVQQNSRTFFLYPQPAAGTVPTLTYSAITDGSLIPIHCSNSVAAGSFNGTADYTCNVILNSLSTSTLPDKIDYFYIKVMPIYSHADIKIKTNDIWGQSLNFIHVQAMVDITAKSDSVAKRLQARLDLGGIGPSGSTITSYNIGPADNDVPDFTVRSANAICKRLLEYNSYYSYAQIDGPLGICNQLNTTVYTPAPTLATSIVGNNGQDNNLRVCGTPWNSTEQLVWGCTSASNPDGGQNPPQPGTVSVGYPGAVTVYWRSEDAAYNCNSNWRGDLNPVSTWTTDPNRPSNGTVIGSGSQSFSGITTYTDYSVTCQGPGGSTPTIHVYAWPVPHNTGPGGPGGGTGPGNSGDSSSVYITGPPSYHAGDSYTLTWHEANSSTCTMSGGNNQPWSQSWSGLNPAGDGASKTFYTNFRDNQTKTYNLNCTDPFGNSSSASYVVATSNYNTQILPPRCSDYPTITDYGNGSGALTWSGSCPAVSASSGYYQLYNCTGIDCNSIGTNGWVGTSGTVALGPGTYTVNFRGGVDPWGFIDTHQAGPVTIQPPPVSVNLKVYGCGSKPCIHSPNAWNNSACVDYVHTYTVCVTWTSTNTSYYANGQTGYCGNVQFVGNLGSSSAGTGRATSGNLTFGSNEWYYLNGTYSLTCYGPWYNQGFPNNQGGDSKTFQYSPTPPRLPI